MLALPTTLRSDFKSMRDCIAAAGERGCTDDELEVALDLSRRTAASRRRRLAIRGLVIDSGEVRLTRSGRSAIVWILGHGESGVEISAPRQSTAALRVGETATTRIAPYLNQLTAADRQGLSRDDLYALIRRSREGDRKALDRIVRAHLRLVPAVLKRILRLQPHDAQAIIQDGNLGLLLAIERFDPNRGAMLTTYATRWIRAMAKYGIAGRRSIVRHSRGAIEPDVSLDVLARHASDDDRWENLLHDVAPDPEQRVAQAEICEAVRDAIDLDAFDAKERDVIRRLGSDEPETLQNIGTRYGVSRQRINQVENEVKAELRVQLAEFAPSEERGLPGTTRVAEFSVVSVTSARSGGRRAGARATRASMSRAGLSAAAGGR